MSRNPHPLSNVEMDALAIARVRFLFDGMPLSMSATVLLSGLATLILSRVEPARTLYAWYACIVLLTAARVAQYLAYRRALRTPATMVWPRWRRHFLIGCTLVGVMWGIASLLLFPRAIEYQVFLSFIIAGTSAGAVTTLSSDRMAAMGFVLPSAVPLAAMLLWQGTRLGLAMGLMVILYLVLVIAVTRRSHVQLMEMVRSNLEASAHRIALERSETERRVSDEKLRALFEFAPLGIALLDHHNQVLDANPALLRLLGWPRAEIPHHILHPVIAALGDADAGLFGPVECALQCRDGRLVTVSMHGMQIEHSSSEVYRWAFIENIDARKATERQLLALNERLRLATEAVRLGVWEYDPDTREVFWDEHMHRIVGHDPKEPVDLFKFWRRCIHPEDMAMAVAQFEKARHDGTSFDYEYRVVRPERQIRVLRIAGRSALDPHLGRVRMSGVAWDITDLRNLDRMKSEFLATVSHELRTPLTSIRGALSLAANGAAGELTGPMQHLMSIAERNAERLTLLIDDLLNIEKIESGRLSMVLTPQPLLPLIQKAMQAQSPQAQLHKVRLDLAPEGEHLVARVDANRFLQIMASLLSNAIKFSPADATVTLQLQARDTFARVAVADQGPGIAADLRDRIFTKFSQGDASDTRNRGGAGLGLAIAKALVEQMGGTIDYVSAAGTGTCFFCELPLVAAAADVNDALA